MPLSKEQFYWLTRQRNDLKFMDADIREDILKTLEDDTMFKQVQEDEKEKLAERYNLSDKDINCIWEEYGEDYRDRDIVCAVYNNKAEMGEEEVFSFGYIRDIKDNPLSNHIDYESFADELLEDSSYLELPSGKIAYLCY